MSTPREKGPTSFAGAWVRTAAGSLTALVMALPSNEARRRVIRLAREFGYDHRTGPRAKLPEVSVESLLDGSQVVVRAPLSADGNVSLLELLTLNALVAAKQPRRVFEIGTFDGRTTLNLAANAPSDATVYTLDLPAAAVPSDAVHADDLPFIARSQQGVRGSRFRGEAEQTRIRQLEGDSLSFDYTPHAASMDFVFVDGSHAYAYVLSDSRSALYMAAPGAMIVWHDYGEWPDVTRALNELSSTDSRFAAMRRVAGTTLVLLET